MNPTLAEDIMRKRAHRSVIVLATLLAWLLVTPDSASADGVTVIVPVNVTHLHEEVTEVRVIVSFINDQGSQVAGGSVSRPPVDRSLQEDVEIVVHQNPNKKIMDAMTYQISLALETTNHPTAPCTPNKVYTTQSGGGNFLHCTNAAFSTMQTYEAQEGPMSDLVPQ